MLVKLVDFFLAPLAADSCSSGLAPVTTGAEDGCCSCWMNELFADAVNRGLDESDDDGSGGGERGGLDVVSGAGDGLVVVVVVNEVVVVSGLLFSVVGLTVSEADVVARSQSFPARLVPPPPLLLLKLIWASLSLDGPVSVVWLPVLSSSFWLSWLMVRL